MMRLAPGTRTATHRTTASNIFAVARGAGANHHRRRGLRLEAGRRVGGAGVAAAFP